MSDSVSATPPPLVHHDHPRPAERPQVQEVIIHSYPPLVFIWPLIFLGFFFYVFHSMLSPVAESWIYIITLVTVLLTIGVDLDRNITIFWLVLIVAVWFIALYLRDVKGFRFFDDILHALGSLNPVWSRDFGLISSVLMSIFYVVILIKARLNDRWRFVNNEIEHWSFGRSDDTMGRGAKRISTNYPDTLEFLLMLSGTITVYSAQGRTILAQIPRVPLLPFRFARINRILESVAVSPAANSDDELSDHEHLDEDNTDSQINP